MCELGIAERGDRLGVVQEVLELVAIVTNGEQPVGEIDVGKVDFVFSADFQIFGIEVEVEVVEVAFCQIGEIEMRALRSSGGFFFQLVNFACALRVVSLMLGTPNFYLKAPSYFGSGSRATSPPAMNEIWLRRSAI